MAQKYNYNTVYILITTSFDLAYHLNLFRYLYQFKSKVSEIVYFKYKKEFEYPITTNYNQFIEYHPKISKKINKYYLS